jgi:chemotaxis-related protein WspB
MLLLLLRSGENVFALDAKRITEVIPRVELRPIPHAPAYLAGLLSYRGAAVPVVDVNVLLGGPPARDALSTRIILLEFTSHNGKNRLLGVVSEEVSHVIHAEAGQFVSPAMSLDEAPYLGAVLRRDEGLVQLLSEDKLLSERMQDALYGSSPEPQ